MKSILLSRAVATATAALCACLLAFAGDAWAFTPPAKTGGENTPLDLTTTTSTAHASSSGGGASLVRTIVGLAIVIAVIWGLAWILRQVKAGRDPQISSAGLASVAALTLGSGRAVHLVRAGNDYVLLGSTEHGVAPIHRYTEQEARDAGLLLPPAPPERSRLLTAASQIVSGTGRKVSQGALPERAGEGIPGSFTDYGGASAEDGPYGPSPVVGPRPDPMRMPSPSSGLLDRLRELTVRR